MKKLNQGLLILSILIPLWGHTQITKIDVYPEILKQKIISVGGNYCQANYSDNAWDDIGEVTLREFNPSHVRMALPLQFRGMKYEEYRGKKIVQETSVITLLRSMQRMKNEFGVKCFTVSVWRVANELVDKPDKENKRRILPDKYNEVIDMIEAFLLEAKNNYGVEVDYFSFNESDGGYNTLFSPQESIRFFKMAGERFRKAGLKTKFLWADTAQTKGTVEFATMIAADSTIWKYLGPLCFHSWWSEDIPNSEFEKIAGLAKAWNKEVWCSELGFDAMAWKIKGMNASWDYALRFAKISHRMLKYAEVSVSMYWTWQNNYAIMSEDTKTKYPSYFVTKHFVQFLNSGTQVFYSSSNNPDILPIAGQNNDGNYVIQLINVSDKKQDVEIQGLPGKPVFNVSTTQDLLWNENKIKVKTSKNGTLIKLDANSINTFVFK